MSEKHNAFLSPLKNKGFKEKSRTKVGVDAIGMFTTLESNKSLDVHFISSRPVRQGHAYKALVDSKPVQRVWDGD